MRKRASDVFVEDTFDGIPVKIKVDDGYYDEAWQILDNCGPYAYIDDDWYDYDYEEFNELCCSDGEIEPYSDVLGIYHAETGELLYDGSRPCYSYNQDHSDAIDVAYEMWRSNNVHEKVSCNMRKRAYGGRGVTDQEFDALERYLMEQYGAAHGAMLESAQRGLEYEEAYFEGEANAYSEILTYIDINFA